MPVVHGDYFCFIFAGLYIAHFESVRFYGRVCCEEYFAKQQRHLRFVEHLTVSAVNVNFFKLSRAADVVAVPVRRREDYRQIGELFRRTSYVAKAGAAVYQQSLFAADDKITVRAVKLVEQINIFGELCYRKIASHSLPSAVFSLMRLSWYFFAGMSGIIVSSTRAAPTSRSV